MSLPQPRRTAEPLPWTTIAQALMGAGAILAAGAAAGPVWLIRAGILVASAAGIIAVLLLTRAIGRAAQEHKAELKAERANASEAMRAERKREREVLAAIDHRTAALQERIRALREQLILAEFDLEENRRELASAESRLDIAAGALVDNENIIAQQEEQIASLRATVHRYETELATLRGADEEADAELLALPRRVDRTRPEISEAM